MANGKKNHPPLKSRYQKERTLWLALKSILTWDMAQGQRNEWCQVRKVYTSSISCPSPHSDLSPSLLSLTKYVTFWFFFLIVFVVVFCCCCCLFVCFFSRKRQITQQLQVLHSALGYTIAEGHGPVGVCPEEAVIRGLEEGIGEFGLFSLEKRRLQRDLVAALQYLKVCLQESWRWTSSW